MMPGSSCSPSAGERWVTTHSFQHNVLLDLKLLRGRPRNRRPQNPERIVNTVTRARDSGFTY